MALTAKVLNSEATLNSFRYTDSQDFIPGENVTLNLQLFDSVQQIRYVPPSTAVITLTFLKDGGDFQKTATLNMDDRSLLSVALTQLETEDLYSGNVEFSIDLLGDGTQIKKGQVKLALRRLDFNGC